MQLREIGLRQSNEQIDTHLALLRLTMKSLEAGELTPSYLNDVRLVLDEVTRALNQHSQVRRFEQEHEEQRNILTEWFVTAIHQDSWPLDIIREIVTQLYRRYLHDAQAIWWFQAEPEEPFRWAASHGLNTAQVLQRMLHPARHSSRHIHNAILAGLLHDLGMTRLPVKVLTAQEQTNSSTRQQWRSHAAWLAERVRPQLHPEEFDIALAIAQHHERLDGSGYPNKMSGNELIELARQLAVADVYAALCQPRPHRAAHSSRQAVQLVLHEAKTNRLDPQAATLLLPWALAPIGTQVELADGTEAKVIAWHSSSSGTSILRPVIELAHGHHSQIIDLDLARDRHIIQQLTLNEKQAG